MREMLKKSANRTLVHITSSNSNNNNNSESISNNLNNNNNNEDVSANQNEEEMLKALKKNGTVLDDLESGWDFVKPSEPPELAKWMEYNEISSLKLRSEIL